MRNHNILCISLIYEYYRETNGRQGRVRLATSIINLFAINYVIEFTITASCGWKRRNGLPSGSVVTQSPLIRVIGQSPPESLSTINGTRGAAYRPF